MLSNEMKKELINYLKEDKAGKDITSLLIDEKKIKAKIIAKENCMVSGIEEINFLCKKNKIKTKKYAEDGKAIRKNQKIIELDGSNRKIFAVERTLLNILSRMSGVATACNKASEKAGKHGVKIAVTRKTFPGFRHFDKKAALAGNALKHRMDLSDMILIKDNHLTQNSIKEILEKAKQKKAKTGKKVEIEVDSKKQALQAIRQDKYNPDIIMLDNFSVKKAGETIKLIREKSNCLIEVSGGISMKNLEKYAKLKPDIISMGVLTRNAEGKDFSMVV